MTNSPCAVKAAAFVAGLLMLLALPAPLRAELKVKEVTPGVYYGNSPKSDSDYRELQVLGVKTVLDLRKFVSRRIATEQDCVPAYGMVYRQVAMGFQPTRDCTPEPVLQIMHDPSQQPIYVHCGLGRDRTALVAALYRVRYVGWTPEAAHAQMKSERFNRLLLDLDRYFSLYARP